MADASIPFPLSTFPGATAAESAGRLINCEAEPLGQGARAPAVWKRMPGLTRFCTTTQTGFRGALLVGSTLYCGFSGKATSYTSAGAETVIGNLSGTKQLWWARNNKTPTPDVVAVDVDNGAFTVTSGSVTSFADVDLPIPNSVCFIDGYFLFGIGDGRMFSTGLNDVTVSSLDFAKAEAKPDGITAMIGFSGRLWAMGPTSIEIWYNAANTVGFPFSREVVIQRGLAGRFAASGYEDGAGSALILVADDNTVVKINGYQPEKISPPDLDRLIEAVSDKDTLKASTYVAGGKTKWVLSSPTWTWEYNINSGKWAERQSYGLTKWRGVGGTAAFGKWICGDTQSGDLLYVDDAAYTENSAAMVYELQSGPVQKFPHRIAVARADFMFAPGTGVATGADPIQTDPQVEISWSRDGGTTWGNALQRKIGRQSVANRPVTVTRCGLSTRLGHRWRLRVSDPVYVALMMGDQSSEMRAQ